MILVVCRLRDKPPVHKTAVSGLSRDLRNEISKQYHDHMQSKVLNELTLTSGPKMTVVVRLGDRRRQRWLQDLMASDMITCDCIGSIKLQYYGNNVSSILEEEIMHFNVNKFSESLIKEKVHIIQTNAGLGHRFHIFGDEYKHVEPFVLTLDDDAVVGCKKLSSHLHKIMQMESRSSVLSRVIAIARSREVKYCEDGTIRYVGGPRLTHKSIALTMALLAPTEMLHLFTTMLPNEMFDTIDHSLNCEDILMNYFSGFLNQNVGLSYSADIATVWDSSNHGLSHKNGARSRSDCVYLYNKLFSEFGMTLQYCMDC